MGILARFLGAFGVGGGSSASAPAEKGSTFTRQEPSRVVDNLPIYLQLQRIGGNLTPSQVSDILRSADQGYCWRLVDLANEARQKDCHLHSVLQTREIAFTGLQWQMLPGGKRAVDKKASAFCEDVLRKFEDLPRLFSSLIGAMYHGHAVEQLNYIKEQGKIVPRTAVPIHARRFVYAIEDGRLRQWDATGSTNPQPYPGIDLQAEYPGRFIQFQPRVNGDVPAREGLSHLLVWASLFRTWDLKDWLALGEIAWKPWRRSYYKPGTDKRAIDDLIAIMQQMTATGIGVFPVGTQVDIDWPDGGSTKPTHKEMFDALGAEMSKATLGQTLTTEQGSRGSQSLGRVHDNVRRDILISDASQISACLRRDMLTWIVRLNFGPDVAVPYLQFITEDGVDLVDFSQGISNLKAAGLKIKASDVYEKAGLSEPAEGDELLGASEDDETDGDGKKPPPGAPPPEDEKPPPKEDEGEDDEELDEAA